MIQQEDQTLTLLDVSYKHLRVISTLQNSIWQILTLLYVLSRKSSIFDYNFLKFKLKFQFSEETYNIYAVISVVHRI